MSKKLLNTAVILSFAGLLFLCASALLPDIVSVSSTVGGRELPIYCVETEKPQISISFDAAWGNEDTQTLLDILAKHNVKATFFMTGGWVESYPDDVHNKVKELTGYDMFLFRPPYGDYNNEVVSNARKNNYYPIQWNIDSLDWKDYGADDIVKRVTESKNLGNGSIILCHNGAKYTKDALDAVLTTLQDKGYEFVPISQLIYRENYHMNHEGRQIPDKN